MLNLKTLFLGRMVPSGIAERSWRSGFRRLLRAIRMTTVAAVVLSLVVPNPGIGQGQTVVCSGNTAWIASQTFDSTEPVPADEECEFYKRSWQAFLFVTRTNSASLPAFVSYGTFRSVFLGEKLNSSRLALTVRTPETPAGPVFDGGIDQAVGSRPSINGAVVDKNGNPIFYSLSIDPTFETFIVGNKLNDLKVLRDPNVDPEIQDGSIELKASWQIVEGDVAKFANYLVVDAQVFPLIQKGPQVQVDDSAGPRQVKAALLGLHVVFKLANHRELIWATFEHINQIDQEFDLAPRASGLVVADQNQAVSHRADYVLYNADTSYNLANLSLDTTTLLPDGHLKERSSIYRSFPFSQDGHTADPMSEDPDVKSLNSSMLSLLAKEPNDFRKNYKLVGAIWLEKGSSALVLGKGVSDDDLLGERGLSNVSIESLTQDSSNHCFACHKPTAGPNGLPAKKVNVSHLFSKAAIAVPAP